MSLRGPHATAGALRAATGAAAAIVVARSFVFVAYEGANFDSDQAVFGLMAKHLAELRAFPLFAYGQSYMLAVSTWLAAPCVALLGPTVLALKLPIVAVNVAAACLLLACLVRDAGLSPAVALAVSLPFTLPPVIPAALLTQHAGGNVEPFLYVLLLWVLRARPIGFGVVAAIGFYQREFTAYGPVALAVLALAAGRAAEPAVRRFALVAAAAFASVAATIEALRPFSTYAGARGTGAGWKGLAPAAERLAALGERTLPMLYGLRRVPVAEQNVRSELVAGTASAAVVPLLGAVGLLLAWRLARSGTSRQWRAPAAAFPWFLVLVGVQALVAHVLLGRGGGGDAYLRYILLALLLPIGCLALALQLEPRARAVVVSAVVAWAALNAADHARLVAEYALGPPPNPPRVLADDLVAHGVRFGAADYWTAYHVSYLAGERVKLHARGFNRIGEYRTLFLDNLASGVDVREAATPCDDGRSVAGFCIVGPPAPRRRPQTAETE